MLKVGDKYKSRLNLNCNITPSSETITPPQHHTQWLGGVRGVRRLLEGVSAETSSDGSFLSVTTTPKVAFQSTVGYYSSYEWPILLV